MYPLSEQAPLSILTEVLTPTQNAIYIAIATARKMILYHTLLSQKEKFDKYEIVLLLYIAEKVKEQLTLPTILLKVA